MSAIEIRPASENDLRTLVRIYNHYVESTHITFDTEPFSVEARFDWFSSFALQGPHRLLVATSNDQVVGYASSSTFRHKPAYSQSVETTIYLDPEFSGRGLGCMLYGELLKTLDAEPTIHRAFGGIALPNDSSVALHEKLGFEYVGTFCEVGYKFGKYWDVSWYERSLE